MLIAGALAACSAVPANPALPGQNVELDGLRYKVEQLTAGTWSATPPAGQPDGPPKTAALVRVIEKASNCKVTDSHAGQQGAALTAQVDCGSRIKN